MGASGAACRSLRGDGGFCRSGKRAAPGICLGGVTGAVGWGCYWLYLQWQPSVAVASLLASLMLALLSRVFSVVRRCPATVFLISGIFALVPGAGIYYTAYYFIMGDNAMAVAKGVETFKIAVALAVGIVLVLALPGRLFEAFAPCAGKKKGER